mmetsp:Transcript_37174/g.96022  ORF Transcript_37174/g.96022 Transcript_37174/m.96022 type:complete len:200 (+) Transcript_37174:337-936(+)
MDFWYVPMSLHWGCLPKRGFERVGWMTLQHPARPTTWFIWLEMVSTGCVLRPLILHCFSDGMSKSRSAFRSQRLPIVKPSPSLPGSASVDVISIGCLMVTSTRKQPGRSPLSGAGPAAASSHFAGLTSTTSSEPTVTAVSVFSPPAKSSLSSSSAPPPQKQHASLAVLPSVPFMSFMLPSAASQPSPGVPSLLHSCLAS